MLSEHYCTILLLLLNSPLTAQNFDPEAFMDKFKDRFLQSVDSHAIVLRLEIEKVISEKLSHSIKNQCVGDGNEELFLYLQKNTGPKGIRKLCDVMMSKAGYDNMVELGQDMKKDLDLLTSTYMCINDRTCRYVPDYM